ncbi:ABC transporter ATP-binding protein [Rhodoferax saidenbachensis]|uniref:Osmoprotectant transport system ATP-binding protein n=1 Tax=Rhodoferax saidenbachensis TaxID=1484693 RepID=A0ABU1ZIR1_9BURK|nr:ABC transporter ATP-binding protein [Rhodoferax saidenbachensis]MDR7305427.1 osmoprotectant transport system ATP-binding protein [Rhodoferax saidenbachensis]
MITFDNTSKSYGGTSAIAGLNLNIARGELVVLIGPSGSGKSTALKMINRMVDHDGGRILLDGKEIYSFNVRDLRRRMGYAIQSVGLFPHWTVERNIATVPQLLGWSAERIEARVTELLTLFAMDPVQYRTRLPHQLSGGQQQRVGVARALAADPDVLLMDEPFGALDPVTRAALQLELKRVHQASGKTIVLVTHDIDEALLLATRIVLLREGRIVQIGTPLELLSAPVDEFVEDFLGRADRGLKLLSLRPIAPLVTPLVVATSPGTPHASIAHTATVREAISCMAVHAVSALRVEDAAGATVGQVNAADLLAPAAHG